ncbi:glycine reductase [Aminithiophilus ramosus]|uniref:Glycine reductase n=2 Tax=Synergistales TaxID=649776 RepID=A0A9Q7AA92_9BACT|nr:glycine/sarcosine/betaine reductase complex component C subunit beta [Aminithiophilus ramosus]QTX33106.1 glycine reductase [Aminithiophilus ramosus]QVL37132.1 glycine reductase [Synergistota bacterium]
MTTAAIKATAYALNHVPELARLYGNTPWIERKTKKETEFLEKLPGHLWTFDQAASYAPNRAYIGAIGLDELARSPKPWHENLAEEPCRYGRYGEIMPEEEFLGLLDICDVFDLVWLERDFASDVAQRLDRHPLVTEAMKKRLEKGHPLVEIDDEVRDRHALPLSLGGRIVGCVRQGHDVDECLEAYVLLENLACKAGGVLALLHLLKNAAMAPEEVHYVIECSEEAAGDMNQRGGGNFAKAVAEIAGCVNASGMDVRGFCAGPVNAVIAGASLVAAGAQPNCVVLGGGAVPKLFMNAKDHVRKGLPALEDVLGNFALLLVADDGTMPVIRLDALGKHTVGAGASPQAVTTALVLEPLQKVGLSFADVDRYAAELHNAEVTLPAGAGDVPLANAKMIAALAVMKGQLEKADMMDFVARRGLIGFAPTQGHIPSGVPFLGHACDAISAGTMRRAMIIGKGSLFLARLTNLADGASFLVEAGRPKEVAARGLDREAVRQMILEALGDVARALKGD